MKVVFIDWGMYIHKAIWSKSDISKPWLCLHMMLADLKKIGLSLEDKVIIAIDNHEGIRWRSTIDPTYKANRQEIKDNSDIDWEYEYSKMNRLVEQLDSSTSFYFVSLCTDYNNQFVSLEADDIMSYGSRYYKDNEIVIVSFDSDLEQLCVNPNVKIYSPVIKRYKIVKDPIKVLTKKIIGKEVSDNLKDIVMSEVDYERRKKIVNLLELPAQIEQVIKLELDSLTDKVYNASLFPYLNLKEKFDSLFEDTERLTYEDSLKYLEKKTKKQKKIKTIKKQLTLSLDKEE